MNTDNILAVDDIRGTLKKMKEGVKKQPGLMKSTCRYLDAVSGYVERIATATGRFMEIVAEALHVPLSEIGPLSLQSTKVLPFSSTCAAFGRGAAVTMRKEGERKEDILNGLHESIANRVMALVKKVGIADKFVITGGIGRNVGLVSKIEERLEGLKITLPQEPMIVGAVGAALFALDRAKKKGTLSEPAQE